MPISVFELFKIGIGPSSSHTVGPMQAAYDFAGELYTNKLVSDVTRIEVQLFGSLSATGIGHGTDRAVIMGLMGERPDRIDPALIDSCIDEVHSSESLRLDGRHSVPFLWRRDMQLHSDSLPYHPNAMRLVAYDHCGELYRNTYYSVGGGFVIDEAQAVEGDFDADEAQLPYNFQTAADLMRMCRENSLRISELMLENEKVWRSEAEIRDHLLMIWTAMQACVKEGMEAEGLLPGGLNVRRRAKTLYQRMLASKDDHSLIASTMSAMDWVNLFALAVNEENAAGGRMVTAPTNGAAGIIPAVLHYYMQFRGGASERDVVDFLLTAGAVGVLCKKNASISGAEVGCQGEVGSACAMAAAGLAELMGGSVAQLENAAEIGLEHNLGLTCDPVGGLVQVPCIERNAIAAVKAINAAQMALRGDGEHFISLDKVIRTMRDTGADMQEKYKETSMGGLAVNAIEC